MKLPKEKKGRKDAPIEITDADFAGKYPTVTLYMTDGFWEGGKVRELSTISINFSTGYASVNLSDHALQQSMYTSANSVQEALELMEGALADGTAQWRAWKLPRGKK